MAVISQRNNFRLGFWAFTLMEESSEPCAALSRKISGPMLVGRAALRPGGGRPQGPSQREAFHLIENNSDWCCSNCLPADLATDEHGVKPRGGPAAIRG
jgi:hypothetical protein